MLSTVNQVFAAELSCPKRISVRCKKCVISSEFVICCRNWIVCSELTFIVENVLATVN
jgi:hypothetical protein